jgi:hypothetical protein
VPDSRAVFLIPAGIAFSGSLLAVKLECLLLALFAVVLLHVRRGAQGGGEAVLPASGLLLLSPILLSQVDAGGRGIFLLLSFLAGAWAHEIHRTERVAFGGYFFLQLALCVLAVSLHPAGLALPLLLSIHWWQSARKVHPAAQGLLPGSNRIHMLVGLAIATFAGLGLARGWPELAWLQVPPVELAAIALAFTTGHGAFAWILGTLLLVALAGLVASERASLRSDPLFAMLCLALVLGLPAADGGWALLALVVLAHWGLPRLLRADVGAAAQRVLAFTVLFLSCTAFLVQDRSQWQSIRDVRELSPTDRLIRTLAGTVAQAAPAVPAAPRPDSPDTPAPDEGPMPGGAQAVVRVASQWPARTMVACACTVLPLPPALEDQDRFAANLRGLSFVIFDPRDPVMLPLARNFSLLGGARSETLSLQAGGVLVRLLPSTDEAPPPSPAIPGKGATHA